MLLRGMTPQDRIIEAIKAELRRQQPSDGQFYYVDAANTKAAVIDATVDLEAIADAVLRLFNQSCS